MKTSYYLICLLAILPFFASCEKEIKFKGEQKAPLLVMNGYLTPDSVVNVHLTKSRFILDTTPDFDEVKDATVELYVNGALKERLQYVSGGNYRGNYYPHPNDEITVKASAPGMNAVEATTRIPNDPDFVLTKSDVTYSEEDSKYFTTEYKDRVQHINYEVTLKDKAEEENFYFVKIYHISCYEPDVKIVVNANLKEIMSQYITNGDISVGDLMDINSDENDNRLRNIFADTFVNGKELTLLFKRKDVIGLYKYYKEKPYSSRYSGEDEYQFTLSSMSKELYQYIISADKAYYAGDNPFSEPVQVKSNVKNGLGILGSYTSKAIKYRFKVWAMDPNFYPEKEKD